MAEIPRSAAFGKLNAVLYKGIESATTLCKLRGNPYVELAHWLNQLFQLVDSDLHRIIRHFDLDAARLSADLSASLDALPRGASAISDFSSHIMESIEQAWVYSSLLYRSSSIRGGYLLVGILKTPNLKNALLAISAEFRKVNADTLTDQLDVVVKGSPEAELGSKDGSRLNDAAGAPAPAEMGQQEALAKFAINLCERARQGELDPVTGRDDEIRQIIDILMRRRQNNPILTGEAGVGKTAVVEGFALRVVGGDVPPALKDVEVYALDIGLLQAGASMKGEFEARLRQVIEEVQSSPRPIILFVDEAHTLIGAGGAAGTGDAANLLKPALARGTLRTIAATTWDEYKKYFEKDPALTRRFQVVQVQEPSEEKAIAMLRGVAAVLQKHHRVLLLDSAIEASVRLSHRYIPARQLPDKAVSLLDTACARVAVSQHATPAEVEDCRRRISLLEGELDIIRREAAVGIDAEERRTGVVAALEQERERLDVLNVRWKDEQDAVDQILALRETLLLSASDESEEVVGQRTLRREELKSRQEALRQLQGDKPLILPSVDEQAVAAVVQDWTGIPVGRMVKDDIQSVLMLADTLNTRVIGQSHAMEMIARRIQTARAKLDNPNKPVGVFMLCGTSGVGKTETALALAEALYGGEQNVITINMSEYQEAHTVSTLKGAPPGYVGYGEGGVLTEAVRRRPYSVVLLDEVEKAHPDVHEMFFQVFDKGYMEDGEGRFIDFKNTIILLTSNAGSDLIMSRCEQGRSQPDPEQLAIELRGPLLDVFPAALLGRLVVIPYYPLSQAMLQNIVRLQLNRIRRRVQENHGIPFEFDDAAVRLVVDRCNDVESGGRMIDAILTNTLLPRISREYLSRLCDGVTLSAIRVTVEDNDFTIGFDA